MASNDVEVLEPVASVEKLTKFVSERALNRRHFMAALGVAGAAVGTGLVSSPTAVAQNPKPSGYQQIDVLNFLLNIKYLKATFYSFVTQGTDFPASSVLTGTGQIYNQPLKVTFTGPNAAQITDMFNEMFFDELNQIIDLRNLIGSSAVSRQTINMLGTGTIVVTGAGATPITATYTPSQAIAMARIFEDVSASAFAGALAYLTGANLSYAAQALAVDGFHAGAIRLVNIQNAVPYQATQYLLLPFTANLTSGNPVVAALFTTQTNPAPVLPVVGNYVQGPGIPLNTSILAISGANTAVTGTFASGKTAVTAVSSITGLAVGQIISGNGIPANTTIAAIGTTAPFTLTLSAASTAAGTNATLTAGAILVTLSANPTASGVVTISTFGSDAQEVQPFDFGTAALAAAGPTLVPGSNPPLYQGFFDTAGSGTGTPSTPAGFAFARSFSQVLSVLYASTTIQTFQGGYFPVGVSGTINVV